MVTKQEKWREFGRKCACSLGAQYPVSSIPLMTDFKIVINFPDSSHYDEAYGGGEEERAGIEAFVATGRPALASTQLPRNR